MFCHRAIPDMHPSGNTAFACLLVGILIWNVFGVIHGSSRWKNGNLRAAPFSKGANTHAKGNLIAVFFSKGGRVRPKPSDLAREARAHASGAAGPSQRISTLKIKRSIAFLLFAPWAGQFSAGADEVENNDNDMLESESAIV